MYRIIGGDHNEYGPVGSSEIEKWIAEGRADGQTRAQGEGQTEWRPLATFPEFAAALQARARVLAGDAAAASGASAGPVLAAATMAPDDWQLDIGACFSRSFGLLQRHFWLVVGATLLVWAIQASLCVFLHVLGGTAFFVLRGVFAGGMFALFLKLIRSQPAAIGDVFIGFESAAIGPLILTGLIAGLLITFGIGLCILPGVYLWVAWTFALPLVIDKKLDFWTAMETSRQVVTKHWWIMFALLLLAVLLLIVGSCVFFIAMPVVYGAIAYAYEDIFNRPGAQLTPAPSIPTS